MINLDDTKLNMFILNRSEITARFEAEYYKPSLYNTEKLVKRHTTKRLKDFIIKIASGATPSITEEEKYYGDKDSGIPFLRVQNLQTNGKLNLQDVKYINKATHEGYLKRSQVGEFDLLIKITGVGRMAIASVAPAGFIGNTNQHLVVIKTGNKEISEYLAKYLNLDIVEKLASRRSTGATRPALDYPALKSIPVIQGIDFSILDKAEIIKSEKEKKAIKLLNSIDELLLQELNITLPEVQNSLSGRIFLSKYSEIAGGRTDPGFNSIFYKQLFTQIKNDTQFILFRDLILSITKGETPLWRGDEYMKTGVPFFRVQNISENGIIKESNFITEDVHKRMNRSRLYGGEILYTMAGSIGIATVFPNNIGEANINQAIAKILLKDPTLSDYIVEMLNSKICRLQANRFLTTSAQPNINFDQIKAISIPVLNKDRRTAIVATIKEIRKNAQNLFAEANTIVESAKNSIEKQIIGSK